MLRALIRQCLLTEAASTVEDAIGQGLALRQSKLQDRFLLVLFDPDEMLQHIQYAVSRGTIGQGEPWYRDAETLQGNYVWGSVLGLVQDQESGPCRGAYQVFGPAAISGYGPMLYDISMGLVPGRTLTSDKQGGTSMSARSVWQYYYHNRSDVSKAPFDDINDPQTPDPDDDCELMGSEVLDTAYTAKSPVNTGPLRDRYRELIKHARELGVKRSVVDGALLRSAEGFYGQRRDQEEYG